MTTVTTSVRRGEAGEAAAEPDRVDGHAAPGGNIHLAHHFDTSRQQFEAAKLGMWLFLATEVLLFGGLFCLYAVLRGNHPDIFAYGSEFLDTRWGIINTAVLITSSMTMAIGVTAAQRGSYRLLVSMLLATFLGGAMFMSIKYVEYHHKFHERLVWGVGFYDRPDWAVTHAAAAAGGAPVEAAHVPDVEHGRTLWAATCRSCHGPGGEGVTGQGKDIRGAEFVTSRTDEELLQFIKTGRLISDPLNTTGVAMPPKGGNPLLRDNDLLDVIALVRTFEGGAPAPAGAADEAPPETVFIERSSIPAPPAGPVGVTAGFFDTPVEVVKEPASYPPHALDPERPPNAHLFFVMYFCMTGLHGLHVLAGMGVIGWLAFRAIRRDFGPGYFTPVDLGGLYWHLVDLIWIFLFPMLYLIA